MYAYVLHMYECHDASETVGSQVIVLPFLLLTNGNMRTKVLSLRSMTNRKGGSTAGRTILSENRQYPSHRSHRPIRFAGSGGIRWVT